MRFALAILHAWIMMQTSMRAVLISPQPVLIMYTSSSRTDSAMRTMLSPMPFFVTSALARGMPSLKKGHVREEGHTNGCIELRVPSSNDLRELTVASACGEEALGRQDCRGLNMVYQRRF